jgi:hypothetical protein
MTREEALKVEAIMSCKGCGEDITLWENKMYKGVCLFCNSIDCG